MKNTLVIGSTVIDVVLSLPNLPRRGEDINILSSEFRLGGCAHNVYRTLKLFDSPALLCSPVGTGVYGRMVKELLEKEGISPFVNLEQENGCCYCLVEADGERSFLSDHGAEYLFSRSWMKDLDFSQIDSVFICGLEVEEPTGDEIVDFVYEHPGLELYFAPGPRIKHIPQQRMERLLSRRSLNNKGPLFHLNETEAFSYAGKEDLQAAAEYFAEKTQNNVVITLGERGCFCLEKLSADGTYVPAYDAEVVDTVGAGDAHCGALIACLKKGMDLSESCRIANRIGAAVVGKRGAVLDKLP